MKTIKEIAQIIKEIRKENKLTQSELASILGISQANLSKIEAGERELKVSQWLKLCEYFSYKE